MLDIALLTPPSGAFLALISEGLPVGRVASAVPHDGSATFPLLQSETALFTTWA